MDRFTPQTNEQHKPKPQLPKQLPLTTEQFFYELFNKEADSQFARAVLERDMDAAIDDLGKATSAKDQYHALGRGLFAVDAYEHKGAPLSDAEKGQRKKYLHCSGTLQSPTYPPRLFQDTGRHRDEQGKQVAARLGSQTDQ